MRAFNVRNNVCKDLKLARNSMKFFGGNQSEDQGKDISTDSHFLQW